MPTNMGGLDATVNAPIFPPMQSHASVAKTIREQKDRYPEKFCPEPRCLWRIWTRDGAKPCPKHMNERFKEST